MGEAPREAVAAMPRGEDWVGILVREVLVERLFTERMGAGTHTMLRPCLAQIERVCEALCPVGLAVGAGGELLVGYGPADVGHREIMVVFATPHAAAAVTTTTLFDPDTTAPRVRANALWQVLVERIETRPLPATLADDLLLMLSWRLGEAGAARCLAEARGIRANGGTPTLFVLAAVEDGYSAGAMMMSALPPGLDIQTAVTVGNA